MRGDAATRVSTSSRIRLRRARMSRAYLSLRSNHDPKKHLRAALAELRARFGNVVVSPVYRFPAVGFDGPDFLNLAVAIDSDLDPPALNTWLHALEDRHGRRRDVPRFSSRTLDVDIVLYDDLVMNGPGPPRTAARRTQACVRARRSPTSRRRSCIPCSAGRSRSCGPNTPSMIGRSTSSTAL